MTTLLPALLVLGGRWVFWPLIPAVAHGELGGPVGADRRFVSRHARPIWIAHRPRPGRR